MLKQFLPRYMASSFPADHMGVFITGVSSGWPDDIRGGTVPSMHTRLGLPQEPKAIGVVGMTVGRGGVLI